MACTHLVPAITVAALAGAGVMIVELGAARLVTPYFGQSLYVWTNLIGVVLAALAAGSFVGGRLADRWPRPGLLGLLLVAAAALCGLSPFLVGPVARGFLAPGLDLEVAFEFLAKGSLLTALVVFAPPVVLLGTILPFLVKLVGSDPARLGGRAGLVYAASTAGSIAGTFLTTYVLIEHLGSRRTFGVAALLLAAAAVIPLVGSLRRRRFEVSLLVMAAGAGLAPWATAPLPRQEDDVIAAVESPYQFIRIRRGQDPRVKLLTLNEGLDSFHSLTIEGEILTGGQYYDYHNLLAAMLLPRSSLKVLILGLAAGTNARQLLALFGDRTELRIDGVEIDDEVVRLGHEYMDLPRDPRLRPISMDGRSFLLVGKERYDLILIDAYAQQTYIPFHMSTVEFFELVRSRLRPDGLVGINIGAYSRGDPVLRSIVNTLARVFGEVVEAKIPRGRNYLAYAAADAHPLVPAKWQPATLPEILAPLRQELAQPGYAIVRRLAEQDLVLTDDRAPVETLEDALLEQRSEHLLAEDRSGS
ncbi:MAG: fused MFS/spermidine synthase [Planctomycetota bacterium]